MAPKHGPKGSALRPWDSYDSDGHRSDAFLDHGVSNGSSDDDSDNLQAMQANVETHASDVNLRVKDNDRMDMHWDRPHAEATLPGFGSPDATASTSESTHAELRDKANRMLALLKGTLDGARGRLREEVQDALSSNGS